MRGIEEIMAGVGIDADAVRILMMNSTRRSSSAMTSRRPGGVRDYSRKIARNAFSTTRT
jgi:hypothetical protein